MTRTLPPRSLLCLLGLVVLVGTAPGCEIVPDPCAGVDQACLAVTVESGPAQTYQLSVVVKDFNSTTPLTPRMMPDNPLVFPLRFAIRFAKFPQNHPGQVTVDILALDIDNTPVGEAQQTVRIDNKEKQKLSIRLGAPFDLSGPPDLRPPADLSGQDLTPPADLTSTGLADGPGSG